MENEATAMYLLIWREMIVGEKWKLCLQSDTLVFAARELNENVRQHLENCRLPKAVLTYVS